MVDNDDREKDVLSSDDFKKLEDSEKNKSILGRFSKTKDATAKVSDEDLLKKQSAPISVNEMVDEFYSLNQRFDNILMQVEKNSGKIEMTEQTYHSFENKLDNVTTQIGEIRSTEMHRERFYGQMETQFNEMTRLLEANNPAETTKKFNLIATRLAALQQKMGHFQSDLLEKNSKMTSMQEQLNKIKEYDKMFEKMDLLIHNLERVEATKRFIDDKASSLENTYGKLTQKVAKFSELSDKVDSIEKSLATMQKDMDRFNILARTMATKNDLDKFYKAYSVMADLVDQEKPESITQSKTDSQLTMLQQWAAGEMKKGLSRTTVIDLAIKSGWSKDLVERALK